MDDAKLPAQPSRFRRVPAGVDPEQTADRRAERAARQDALERLSAELGFAGYPASFPLARRLPRRVTLYLGPPNSGKTHAAFERLATAASGAYLAPLRLLALEGRDRLVARGVPCSLLTGEENVPAPGARVVSSTVEMINTRRPLDLAVIDEAQMLFDADRGWAWTQAIVGAPADELLIIASAYAEPAIRRLLAACDEEAEARAFERKQHVALLKSPVSLHALKKGDAVVAFSRREVLALRDHVGGQGHPVSVVYGALPPEVRRREAERFANGESDVLVATDAIGMGLNLPIRRVLFSAVRKFDGEQERLLGVSEVHQIAGRAGRFGLHEEGFAGVLRDAEPDALRVLQQLLARQPKAPPEFKARVAPNAAHVEAIARELNLTKLRAVLGVFMQRLALDSTHFEVAALQQMLDVAEHLDRVAGPLPLEDRFVYAQAPVDPDAPMQLDAFLGWAQRHAHQRRAGEPDFVREVDPRSRLDRIEQALRLVSLWLWLDLRFPDTYGHVDEVTEARDALNDGIERQLKSRRPLLPARRGRFRG